MKLTKPFLLLAALAAFSSAAQAEGYGVYSGRGYNIAGNLPPPRLLDVVGAALGRPTADPTFGTAGQPVPVYDQAALFRLHQGPIYNAPPAGTDLYRTVP